MEKTSHPTFRERRQAAGYKTVAALREDLDARNLRLPTTTVYRLDGGGRPESWERLCLFADLLHISYAKAATEWWNETDGDPCPRGHGCNGILRLPREPTAEHLEVEVTCRRCGTKRRERIWDHHSQRPSDCACTPLGQLLKSQNLTVVAFAEEIGRPLRTVTGWVRREHPPENWEDVRMLARRFNVPEEQAPETFWNQKVDDQCPKHDWCRGRTTLPIDGKAQFLDIRIPCENFEDCGTYKFYRGETRYQHHDQQFCRDCGIKARRKPCKPGPAVLPKDPSRRVWVNCPGYKPHKEAKKAIHVDDCPRRVERARRRVKFRKSDAFKLCSLAAVRARTLEALKVDFLEGARKAYRNSLEKRKQFREITGRGPFDDIPRVQSLAEFKKQLSWCYQLSYVDEHGNEKVFELAQRLKNKPKATAPKYKRRATGDRIPADKRHVAGGFMMQWGGKKRLTCLQDECERCHTFTFSTISARTHDYCRVNDIHEPPRGVRSSFTKKGLQRQQRHALWALLQRCGMSLTELKKKTGVTRKGLIKGIRAIKKKWPEEKRVQKRYQGIVSLLPSAPANLLTKNQKKARKPARE